MQLNDYTRVSILKGGVEGKQGFYWLKLLAPFLVVKEFSEECHQPELGRLGLRRLG